MRRFAVFGMVASLMLVLVSSVVFADGGEDSKKIKAFELQDGFQLLSPFKAGLSGFAFTMMEEMSSKESPPQAPMAQGGSGGTVPYRSPAPAFSRNILVSRDSGLPIHTEPHIAVNPKDPSHIVMAEIDYALRYNPIYTSFDGGENWRGPTSVPLTEDSFSGGDPVVAFDRHGKVFQAFMSVGEKSYDVGPFPIDIPKSDIAVSYSEDGGISWRKPYIAATNEFRQDLKLDPSHRVRGFLVFTFLDKPWMDIGPNRVKPDEDIIYVTYTEFAEYFAISYSGELAFLMPVKTESTIMAVVSKDNGKSWSKALEISPRRKVFELGQGKGGEIKPWVVQGSQPKIARDGTVYISWYDSTEDGSSEGKGRIYIAQSISVGEGNGFINPMLAAEFLEVPRSPGSVPFRNSSSFPQLALGDNGEVYIVYGAIPEDKEIDEGDIYFTVSSDKNRLNFSKPVRLNSDKTQHIQFFPAVATDIKGNIHVMWGDTRDDPTGLKYHIYYTRSLDRGKTWGFEFPERGIRELDTRVTDFPSNPNNGFPRGRFIGDYFAIAAGSEEDVYMVWADTRLGEYGPMSQKIGFARRKAIPSPEVFLNPARGPAGQEVELQASNFQPDMNVFVRMGGSITPIGRSNADGGATFKFFAPIASQGTHDILVFDESGNTAVGSYYIDFGFSDLKPSVSKDSGKTEKTETQTEKSPPDNEHAKTQNGGFRMLIAAFALGALMAAIVSVVTGRMKKARNK